MISDTWQEHYAELSRFIKGNPSIEITGSRIRLPDELRSEFYRFFDSVRTAFVNEKARELLATTDKLKCNYTEAEQRLMRLLHLGKISLPPDLDRFLKNPTEQLIRDIFDPLFGLIKETIDIEAFESIVLRNIETAFKMFYRSGCEKWLVLSLADMLEPDMFFRIEQRKLDNKDLHLARGGKLVEEAPAPHEAQDILFSYEPDKPFITPDLMIRSKKIGAYVSFGSWNNRSLARAVSLSTGREWYPLESFPPTEPGTILVYADDDPKALALIADAENICRPNMIIDTRSMGGIGLDKIIGSAVLRSKKLKPEAGTFIIAGKISTEQEYQNSQENIRFIADIFAPSGLNSIIGALAPRKTAR